MGKPKKGGRIMDRAGSGFGIVPWCVVVDNRHNSVFSFINGTSTSLLSPVMIL
jgi:hypothetical protein